MSATGRLASYAVETRYADLPAQVVRQAKHAIRDSLGCILGGSALEAGQRLCELLLPMASGGQSTVAGSKNRVPPPLAGYLNAQLANMLDFDDTLSEGFLGHPGATIVPAALAAAEQVGASGKDLLTAVVVGYDVCSRVGTAGKPTFERSKQVRGMATWQVFGAAAAAVHVMGLDAEAAARAFGLAALHAPVPSVGKIYEERPMWALKNNFGWATQGALLGTMFAAEGLDANHNVLEGETGFWAMAGSDHFDPGALTEGLGSHYSLLDTSFKPYPCCRFTHSALDALDQIVRQTPPQAGQARRVLIVSSSKIRSFADYRPQSLIDAQFSLPYLAAMVLLREPPGYGWLKAGRWRDAGVRSLADRVVLEVDRELESNLAKGGMANRVTVEFEGGQTERVEVLYPRGDPRNPLSPDELRAKFLALAEPVIGLARAHKLDNAVDHLEGTEQVADLTKLLADNEPT